MQGGILLAGFQKVEDDWSCDGSSAIAFFFFYLALTFRLRVWGKRHRRPVSGYGRAASGSPLWRLAGSVSSASADCIAGHPSGPTVPISPTVPLASIIGILLPGGPRNPHLTSKGERQDEGNP